MPDIIGRNLGHYRIVEKIGEGGMGEVYKAHDERLDRDVAIKVLPAELVADPDRLTRFEREAKAVAKLDHPNILAIHQLGTHEGAPFIVTELLEGESLREVVASGALTLSKALEYGGQVATGLAAAHDKGITHRDLKPENLFLTRHGLVKILDFGLAKLKLPEQDLATETPTATLMTSPGAVIGTVAYMAPEQVKGHPADHRSDIFALGVVLYEMLAGRRPFRGATAAETTAAILKEDAEPLSTASSTAPPALASIVSRCLEKRPEDRFRSAHDLALAIHALSGVPAVSAVPTPGFRTRRWLPGLAFAAVGAVAAIILALYLGTREAEPAPGIGASGRPAVAVMRFEDHIGSEESAWLSGGLPSMLLTGLAQTQGLDVISSERIQEVLKQLGDADIENLDPALVLETARRAGAGAVVVGGFYKSGAEVRIDAQVQDVASNRLLSAHTVRGNDVFPLVDELTEHIRATLDLADAPAGLEIAEVTTSSLEAYRLYQNGREAASEVRREDAVRLLEGAIELDPLFAMAHFELWKIQTGFGLLKNPDAEKHRQNALENINHMTERQRLWVLALLAREGGNPTRAAELLEQLITRYPDEERAYGTLALIYEWGVYDPQKSLDANARGVTALPKSGRMHGDYGLALLDAGRLNEARREFETHAELSPRDPVSYDLLGDYFLVVGEPERALEEYARALEVEPSFYRARTGLALAYGMLGRYQQALDEADRFPGWERHALKAFLLSRVGRYRDAEQKILEGTMLTEDGLYTFIEGGLLFIGVIIEMERGRFSRMLDISSRMQERSLRSHEREMRENIAQHAHGVAGFAYARSGNLEAARRHLEALKSLLQEPHWQPVDWLPGALEGEIALTAGDLDAAETFFRAADPKPKMLFHRWALNGAIPIHHHPSRDGLARVARARGDLDGAIEVYRQLNTPGVDCPWTSVLEPRFVLELARLFDEKGDESSAREHYERFLDLWKNADPDLPELAEARTRLAQLEVLQR